MSSKSKQATVVDAGKGRQLNVLGHTVNVMLANADTQGDSFVFETIAPPGYVVPPHVHQHEDEYGYVAEGVFEIFLIGAPAKPRPEPCCTFPRYRARLP